MYNFLAGFWADSIWSFFVLKEASKSSGHGWKKWSIREGGWLKCAFGALMYLFHMRIAIWEKIFQLSKEGSNLNDLNLYDKIYEFYREIQLDGGQS